MPFRNRPPSEHPSLSEEEDSSGTGIDISAPGSQGYNEVDEFEVGGPWSRIDRDELKPSERPRATAYGHHVTGESDRTRSARRQPPRRRSTQDREAQHHRTRRQHIPEQVHEPESEDSGEDYDPRSWIPHAPAPPPGYPNSATSGQSQGLYPGMPHPHHAALHMPPPGMPSNQLVHLNPIGHMNQYGAPYPYGPGFPGPGHHPMTPSYFPNPEHRQPSPPPHHPHLHQPHRGHPRDQRESESPSPPALAHPAPHHINPRYPGPPFPSNDMVPFHHPNSPYFPYHSPYGFQEMMHHRFFNPYHPIPASSPPPPEKEKAPTPPPAAPAAPPEPPQPDPRDEAIARLEKLIIDDRKEREAREALREAALEKAARDKAAAEERAAFEKKIAENAAAKATAIMKAQAQVEAEKLKAEAKAEAEKVKAEAEQAAADEAAKAKKAAEEATAQAVAEAAAAATEAAEAKAAEAAAAAAAASKPPPPKAKPIKFKDALGRKFNFPFDKCRRWPDMEGLIHRAFESIDRLGPHVAGNNYDLMGPGGDIILPQLWDTVIEPDWTVTMHMWPLPDPPKAEPPPPPPADVPAVVDVKGPMEPLPVLLDPGQPPPPPPPAGPKKPRSPPIPGAFAKWMTGGRVTRARPVKAKKKPEIVPQPDDQMALGDMVTILPD